MLCSRPCNEAICTLTKPESKKNQEKKQFQKIEFLLSFIFFRLTQASGNLVAVMELFIARFGRASSNVGL